MGTDLAGRTSTSNLWIGSLCQDFEGIDNSPLHKPGIRTKVYYFRCLLADEQAGTILEELIKREQETLLSLFNFAGIKDLLASEGKFGVYSRFLHLLCNEHASRKVEMRRLVQRAGAINYQSTQSSCNKTKP